MKTSSTNKYKPLTKEARFTLERLLTTKSVKLLNDITLILGKTPLQYQKRIRNAGFLKQEKFIHTMA